MAFLNDEPSLVTELPTKRIFEYIEMPPLPANVWVSTSTDDDVTEEQPPFELTPVCQVEWSGNPYNPTIEAYYLKQSPGYLHLWCRYHNEICEIWQWSKHGCIAIRGVDSQRVPAMHLLHDRWSSSCLTGRIMPFQWINDVGLLNISDIVAVARSVWSDDAMESDLK